MSRNSRLPKMPEGDLIGAVGAGHHLAAGQVAGILLIWCHVAGSGIAAAAGSVDGSLGNGGGRDPMGRRGGCRQGEYISYNKISTSHVNRKLLQETLCSTGCQRLVQTGSVVPAGAALERPPSSGVDSSTVTPDNTRGLQRDPGIMATGPWETAGCPDTRRA